MMTRKHFEALAQALYEAKPAPRWMSARAVTSIDDGRHGLHLQWAACAYAVAGVLAATNPRFDRERFIAACCDGVRGAR
jgi:hypothetical protein